MPGRVPVMMPAGSMPMMGGPPFAPPMLAPPAPVARPPAAPPRLTPTAQAAPARPVVRGQSVDEPVQPMPPPPLAAKPAPLTIPSFEQMGLAAIPSAPAAAVPVDWNAVHQRLDQFGATG